MTLAAAFSLVVFGFAAYLFMVGVPAGYVQAERFDCRPGPAGITAEYPCPAGTVKVVVSEPAPAPGGGPLRAAAGASVLSVYLLVPLAASWGVLRLLKRHVPPGVTSAA